MKYKSFRIQNFKGIKDTTVELHGVEGLLNDEAIQIIRKESQLSDKPTKNQIRRFFQERLASDRIESLGAEFSSRAGKLLVQLKAKLEE